MRKFHVFLLCYEFREYRESIIAYMDNKMNLGLFAVHKIVLEYAERIYAYMEKTPIDTKLWYISVNNITPISRYCPFKMVYLFLTKPFFILSCAELFYIYSFNIVLFFVGFLKPFAVYVHTDGLEGSSSPTESGNRYALPS
jgi:hypothetical protein